MSSFSDQFYAHIVPSASEIAEAMREGLVVLDTNVLLSAYRFAPKAREELLSVLERVRDRAWIPHQVGFEFHKNRFDVIAEHDAAYKELLEALAEHRKSIESDLEGKVRQLSNRSALADGERDRLLKLLREGLQPLHREIERLHRSHGLTQPADSDAVLDRLQAIFTDHVGSPFSAEERSEAEKEAGRRVEHKIPPGYKDAGKANPYGDYFLWTQTITEAAGRAVGYVILVTGDVKEDWYLRVKGQTVIGRPELSIEMQEKADSRLLLMPTLSFLRHAREYLDATVSSDTLQQAAKVGHELPSDVGTFSARELRTVGEMLRTRNALQDAAMASRADAAAAERRVQSLISKLDQFGDSEGAEQQSLREELHNATAAADEARTRYEWSISKVRDIDDQISRDDVLAAIAESISLGERNVRSLLSGRRDPGKARLKSTYSG